jgi:hypothetical protein
MRWLTHADSRRFPGRSARLAAIEMARDLPRWKTSCNFSSGGTLLLPANRGGLCLRIGDSPRLSCRALRPAQGRLREASQLDRAKAASSAVQPRFLASLGMTNSDRLGQFQHSQTEPKPKARPDFKRSREAARQTGMASLGGTVVLTHLSRFPHLSHTTPIGPQAQLETV